MPIRLELTVADLMRVRVASTLGPLAETALAYSVLQPRAGAAPGRGLARVVGERATASDRALASYLWLSPSVGFDLFTVGGRSMDLAEGEASLLDAPDDVWRTETGWWGTMRAEARRRGVLAPAASRAEDVEAALGEGDVERWRRLLGRLAVSFGSWVGPSWPRIKDTLDAEADRLARQAATGGLESLATALGPAVRWSGSSVELPGSGVTGTHTSVIPLRGRGLTIVPSLFALQPMAYVPTAVTEPVLLIVPFACEEPPLAPSGRRESRQPLAAELLGRTRTAVLDHVGRGPRTTSELSRDLGIALSGASQHAAVLRRAGLITTVRRGGHVQHSITELGENLLRRSEADLD